MEKEKKVKEPKAPKQPKVKKSKYPEGYIGRPKPMKTKTFEFHKPTKKFYIGLSFVLLVLGFLTYIVIRLINVGKVVQPEFEYYEYDEKDSSKEFILENDLIKFDFDPTTTQFTVLQKNTGKIWYSNPPAAKQDSLALVKEKNNMMSPLLIKYSTENGTDDVYDIYTKSVQRKFYKVSKKGNEIRVDYTVGEMQREYIFPLAIYQSELDKWEEGLSKSQKNAISRAYHKYTKANFKGADLDAMLAKYPKMEDEPIYIVFENAQAFLKEQMEELFAKQGYTEEDYQRHKEIYKESVIKEVPAFNISVVYKLEKNGFSVEIPFEDISYRIKYPITLVSTLPYFGAGGKTDEGYILVPEGGGSLINFNNGKTRQNGYYADFYGWDYAMDRSAVITETRAAFPVFGIAYQDSSFISVVKEGAEYGGVTAEIAGKLGSYNYAHVDYRMLHSEQYEVTARSQSAQYVYENQLPVGEKIRQVFEFVDSGSYVDMAKAYRNDLFAGKKKVANKDIPMTIEILGAIDKKQQVLGMPKVKPFKLTSYKETADIINQIEDMGIENVNYKLSGFINEGLKPKMLNKVRFIKQLGGKHAFKKMIKSAKSNSSKLYLDGVVQTQYRTNLFNGFFKYKDAARFVSDELCELYQYSPLWYGKDPYYESYFLLNQKLRDSNSDVFIKKAKKYGLDGISYNDNGSILSSDFNDRRITTRATAKNKQIEKIQKANDTGLGVMINAGNDYALNNVDFVTNMTMHGNSYAILDQTVPFYQIALHGYVNYASTPINIGYEKDQIILESAETGAGLMFTFMACKDNNLQETNYTQFYSANFADKKEQFADIYEKYNENFSKVVNSVIVDHSYVSEQVTKTVFDNGYVVYVNFGYKSFTTPDGKHIPDRDYRVLKVEE